LAINTRDKIMWKGTITLDGSAIGTFSTSYDFDVEGNVMSLLHGDNFIGEKDLSGNSFVFETLFNGCNTLISAEKFILPSTTLTEACYARMFYNCSNLITAPSLPATTLADSCYEQMFEGCTSLTTAPILSATALTDYCYNNMFSNCTSLASITCLATNISASNCTNNWVNGVAASGTFTKANGMDNWEIDSADGIPNGWSVIQY